MINRLLFVVVAVGFVAAGTVLLIGIRLDPEHAPMGVYYLSMTCRCAWHGLPKAVMFISPGDSWTTHAVPAPFRFRILVPWLSGTLPFQAETSLSVVTYASLGAARFNPE